MAIGNVLDADTAVREAVGVFDDEPSLQNAVDELLVAGFDRSSLSLLASEHVVEDKLGHRYDKVAELEDDTSVPRIAYVGKDSRVEGESVAISGLAYIGAVGAAGAILAAGGTIAAAILLAGTAGGIGGLIGAILARYMDEHHAKYLQEQLDHGGLLLWVSVRGAEQERRACEILKRCSGDDVHVHDLPELHFDVTKGVSHDTSFMNRLGM
jgi:hypothetical protein